MSLSAQGHWRKYGSNERSHSFRTRALVQSYIAQSLTIFQSMCTWVDCTNRFVALCGICMCESIVSYASSIEFGTCALAQCNRAVLVRICVCESISVRPSK
jgi:hypothetical protein